MIFYMELHVIPWNLCLFPQAGRACAAKTCASRLVAACMQGQPGVDDDSEHSAGSFLIATAARGTNRGAQLVWGPDAEPLRPF